MQATGVDVLANIEAVRERIAGAARRSGRRPEDITLVAVTKTVPPEQILAAIHSGIDHLGENRVQEALAKYGTAGAGGERGGLTPAGTIAHSGIRLHMIGTLQRNKAQRAAALFDWVESVDRPEIAHALDRAALRARGGRPLPVLLEVNVSAEASKSGVPTPGLMDLAETVAACQHLLPSGLMTVARAGAGEAELRETFATLRALLERVRASVPGAWQHLSMGMTGDFEYAIEEGATTVRIGRAIFGPRRP